MLSKTKLVQYMDIITNIISICQFISKTLYIMLLNLLINMYKLNNHSVRKLNEIIDKNKTSKKLYIKTNKP